MYVFIDTHWHLNCIIDCKFAMPDSDKLGNGFYVSLHKRSNKPAHDSQYDMHHFIFRFMISGWHGRNLYLILPNIGLLFLQITLYHQ